MKAQKLLERIVNGTVQNVPFDDLCLLLKKLGFEQPRKGSGSHHIFTRDGVAEIINLQPKGKDAKAYQVRQVREIIERYQLTL